MTADVSVIIPVYNGEAYLAEAIESALGQSVAPAEVIVLDDGSTDSSAEIAQRYPIVYLRQQNAGLASARNAAIAEASGDYLALLDCDDIWLPTKLEQQLAALEVDPEAGYCLTHMRYLLASDTAPAWFKRRDVAASEPCYSPSCWLIRRSTWEKVGLFEPGRRYAEDIDWLARANDLGMKSTSVPEPLVLKRIHDDNLTGQVPQIKQAMLDVLRASARRKRTAEQ